MTAIANAENDSQGATAEILRLADAIRNGRLDERGNAAGLSADSAAVVGAVNQMLDGLVGPLRLASRALDQIAHGSIPEFVTEDYTGEFDLIKRNVNTFLATMYGMHHEIQNLVQAIKHGRLLTRGNDWDFEGKWRELIAGLNEVIDTFMHPFEVVATCMSRISRGDIPEPVKGGYKGGFNEIRRSLNTLIAAVNALIADVDQLCSAAVLGQLATRVDASGHGGDFRKIVDGINNTMDAVVGPLNRTAGVLGKVARGDLMAEVEGDYHGDFAGLQRDVNVMVRNLRASILQIAETAAALSEASSQFQDISTQLSANAEDTSARAGQASTTGQGMAQNIEAVAAGSEDISTSISKIAQEAGEAARLTKATAAATDTASGAIRKLDTSSHAIGAVIQTIGSIAGQTRQISQQAGEQAATAAEAGRGFSVVADEVKRLAQQTRQAADEIGERIGNIEAVVARITTAGAQGGASAELAQTGTQVGKALGTISRLGLQTHMLSVNASIEAARAEEAGRQFSVVAGGVADLSTGTSQAAADIGGQLDAIRADSDMVVTVIGDITGMVHRIDSVCGSIAGAVRNQAATASEMQHSLADAAQSIREVVESMGSVATAAHSTSTIAGQTQAAAASLSGMAAKLRALVAAFQCDHAGSAPGTPTALAG